MTDLKNGIIDLGELIIDRNTTKQEMESVYKDRLNPYLSNDTVITIKKIFCINNAEFLGMFFFKDDLLESITLWPRIEIDEETSSNREKRQAAERAFADKWLFENLGTPTKKDEGITLYQFEWGGVYAISLFRPNEQYNGGFVGIRFDR